MRDATGAKADMPAPVRANPTTAKTSTITVQQPELMAKANRLWRTKSSLGFYDGLVSDAETRREEARRREAMARSASPDGLRESLAGVPTDAVSELRCLCAAAIENSRSFAFDAPPVQSPREFLAQSPREQQLASSPPWSPRSADPLRPGKRQFSPRRYSTARLENGLDDGRTEVRNYEEFSGYGGKHSQSPRTSEPMGDPTPEPLALRDERVKSQHERHSSTLDLQARISDMHYRTREAAKARSRHYGNMRWK